MEKPKYPVYKLLRSDKIDRGLVRMIQTNWVLDAPDVGFDPIIHQIVGIDFGNGDPVYIKPDLLGLERINGKWYPYIIRESFIEEKENHEKEETEKDSKSE